MPLIADLSGLTFFDIQHLILIKFCLAGFVAWGMLAIYFKIKPWIFLTITGALLAAAFLIFMDNLALSFWGLQGDEVTVAAMYATVAKYGLFSDFAYHILPPFYPPMYFWIFGLIGRFLNWNGIIIAKFSVAATYLILPISVYLIQRLYWRNNNEIKDRPGGAAAFLAPLLILTVIDHDAFISKPYEVLSAVAAVLWAVYLILEVNRKEWTWKKTGLFGLAGGIIFMTYYLWLIFAAIAIALAGLDIEKSRQFAYYRRLLSVAAVVLIVSFPYLLPLVFSYAINGTENWQTAFFLPGGLAANFAIFEILSWKNILLSLGLAVILVYRQHKYVRPLLWLLATAYVWWLIGLFTLIFFQTPFQEFKGFLFFDRTILAFALAFGLEKLWEYLNNKYGRYDWQPAVMAFGVIFVGANLFFGTFVDRPAIQQRLILSKAMRPEIVPLVDFLKKDPTASQKLTLQSGINELTAFVPINEFIYFNQNNSHPAAGFSRRRAYLTQLSSASTPKIFYELASQSPYGPIERLILFHDQGKYYIFLNLDEMIIGIKEDSIVIPESLINQDYFTKIFDQHGFAVWDMKVK